MHRTFAGDLDDLRGGSLVDAALDRDEPLEAVDATGSPFRHGTAIGAVLGRNLSVADLDRNPSERELLMFRIDPQRHRRAGAERDR